MNSDDSHVQYTWNLICEADGDEVSIDLWTDDYTVRVDGGDGEDSEGGRKAVEELLEKYAAVGYRVARAYAVNDPAMADGDEEEEPEGRPEECPECGSTTFDFAPNHVVDLREGDAWLCTGCKWGEWVVA